MGSTDYGTSYALETRRTSTRLGTPITRVTATTPGTTSRLKIYSMKTTGITATQSFTNCSTPLAFLFRTCTRTSNGRIARRVVTPSGIRGEKLQFFIILSSVSRGLVFFSSGLSISMSPFLRSRSFYYSVVGVSRTRVLLFRPLYLYVSLSSVPILLLFCRRCLADSCSSLPASLSLCLPFFGPVPFSFFLCLCIAIHHSRRTACDHPGYRGVLRFRFRGRCTQQ